MKRRDLFLQAITRCFFIFIFLLNAGAGVAAAEVNFAAKKASTIVIEEPSKALTAGERLTFEVSWMGVPVGIGTLEIKEIITVRGRPAYHVIAIAKTNDFLSKIYPIYDEAHSYIDAERFCSLGFHKNAREGRYRADETTIYDYNQMKSFYESALNKSKTQRALSSEVQDAVSAFYWFRLQKIQVGKSVKTVINNRDKDWDLEIKILSAQPKELRHGETINTILVEPVTRYKDILERRGRAWVHFSADKRRLPVWITISTPFGPVNGVLKKE